MTIQEHEHQDRVQELIYDNVRNGLLERYTNFVRISLDLGAITSWVNSEMAQEFQFDLI